MIAGKNTGYLAKQTVIEHICPTGCCHDIPPTQGEVGIIIVVCITTLPRKISTSSLQYIIPVIQCEEHTAPVIKDMIYLQIEVMEGITCPCFNSIFFIYFINNG